MDMKYKIKRMYLNEEKTKELVFEQFNACFIFPVVMINFYRKKLIESRLGWLFWTVEYRLDERQICSGSNNKNL